MPALDQTGADRIAPFVTMWSSYTGADCSTIAVLFKQAGELLTTKGYDRYSKTEDETSAGLTIFEALEAVARDHATAEAVRIFGKTATADQLAPQIENDTQSLADELARRLAGVLIVTGQLGHASRDLTEAVWSWTRDAVYGPGTSYRGIEHATRLLHLASIMTMATEVK